MPLRRRTRDLDHPSEAPRLQVVLERSEVARLLAGALIVTWATPDSPGGEPVV